MSPRWPAPTGWARWVTSQGKRFRLHPPTIDVRPPPRRRDQGVPGRGRQTQGQVRAAVPGAEGELPHRAATPSARRRTIGELNQRAGLWLPARVHARPHSTTGVAPAERLEIERRFLGPLPRRRFDTAYADTRRVHPRLPLLEWDGVPYSVPPGWLGHKVACRVEVDADVLEISSAARLLCRHRLPPDATEPVWDPAHRAAAEAIALGPGPPGAARGPDGRTRAGARTCRPAGAGRRRLRRRRRRPGRPLRRLRLHRAGGMTMTDHHQPVRVAQGRPRLPAAGPGRRVLRHPRRPSQGRGLEPRRVPRPGDRRAGRGHHQPAPRRPAALRPLPLPAHHRRVRLRLPAKRRPQARRRPGQPALHRRGPLDRLLGPTRLRQNPPRRGARHPRRRGRLPRLLHHRRRHGRRPRPGPPRRAPGRPSCAPTPPPPCWSSTTWGCCRWPATRPAASSTSSTTATKNTPPRWSRPTGACPAGERSSETKSSPARSSTGSSIGPSCSTSAVRHGACANTRPSPKPPAGPTTTNSQRQPRRSPCPLNHRRVTMA